jgi:hypothetical protein
MFEVPGASLQRQYPGISSASWRRSNIDFIMIKKHLNVSSSHSFGEKVAQALNERLNEEITSRSISFNPFLSSNRNHRKKVVNPRLQMTSLMHRARMLLCCCAT